MYTVTVFIYIFVYTIYCSYSMSVVESTYSEQWVHTCTTNFKTLKQLFTDNCACLDGNYMIANPCHYVKCCLPTAGSASGHSLQYCGPEADLCRQQPDWCQ